jgi:hypothetical protein
VKIGSPDIIVRAKKNISGRLASVVAAKRELSSNRIFRKDHIMKKGRRHSGIASSGNLSSGLGRAWKQRKLVKGKDKVRAPITSGGLPSLGKKN